MIANESQDLNLRRVHPGFMRDSQRSLKPVGPDADNGLGDD
jgi:hypothetical protein